MNGFGCKTLQNDNIFLYIIRSFTYISSSYIYYCYSAILSWWIISYYTLFKISSCVKYFYLFYKNRLNNFTVVALDYAG